EEIIIDPNKYFEGSQVVGINSKKASEKYNIRGLADQNKEYPSGSIFTLNNWQFKVFNYKQQFRRQILLNLLKKDSIKIKKLSDVKYISDKQAALQEIYENVEGTINQNSLVLYSGVDPEKKSYSKTCSSVRLINRCLGCLYTGDYYASGGYHFKQLKKRFEKYWDNIGTIQVPHHGAEDGFNKELYKNKVAAVISYRSDSRIHPAKSTKDGIQESGSIAIPVTENVNSVYRECIIKK
ncbi:MAG: hypothetical protein WCV92_05170, partial [Candidatus Buchananbacteria bacterium]